MDLTIIMDAESAALVLELQAQDIRELSILTHVKRKREGVASNEKLAFSLYYNDLDHSASVIRDRLLTRRIASACCTDGAIINAL